jgi:hypothetical protein
VTVSFSHELTRIARIKAKKYMQFFYVLKKKAGFGFRIREISGKTAFSF